MNNLRHYREMKDLTQAELAKATGIEVTKLSRVEAGGRDLKGQEWKLVAQKLGCGIDELLNYNNPSDYTRETK